MHHNQDEDDYTSLQVIFGIILAAALCVAAATFSFSAFVYAFMIGVFLTFAGFKMLDLKGFAQGYKTYDLLAKKWEGWGYVFPFVELFFGLSMILGIFVTQLLLLEIILMGFSGLGVFLKLQKHERIKCVCLGTFLHVPLTSITLLEDFGMAALALFLLFTHY